MSFAWPQLLWLLALPAALLGWELTRRRRAADPAAHPKIHRAETGLNSVTLTEMPGRGRGGSPRISEERGGPPRPRSSARCRWWLVAGMAFAIVALARPQWGRLDEPVFEQSREILIAMDLSRSMLTPDVPPSRLDRAKLLVQSLLDRLAGERVGLAVFAGTAFLQAPLSADYEILREFLPVLGPDYLPEGGTNYGALLDAAAGAFGDGPGTDRFLIILSDGGATDDDWRSHIGKLKDKGIRVIGLGIGTAAGGFIPDGEGGLMKDERGAVVKAALESDTLRELADKTGGAYRDASQWVDLPALLKATVEAAQKGQFVEKNTVMHIERFQWALAPALLCLLMSFWREFPVRPRPRDMRLVAAIALFLVSVFRLPSSAFAAAASEAPPPSVQLGHIVGRLAAQDSASALDWAELGHETATWGQQAQSAQQSVPPGPVRDALAAVDAGSALDPKAADWPKLRADLEALLKKPEDKKQDQKQDQQKKNQPQQQQKNQQQNQKNQPQNRNQQQNPQDSQQQQDEQQPQQNQGNSPQSQSQQQQQQQPGATQKIGGRSESQPKDPAEADPELAVPLEKLGEVRDQDSPGALFEMIENNEPRPPPNKNGKNW